jgi:enamine deaminase RidA (YjgF/YER057c/UK114 family)
MSREEINPDGLIDSKSIGYNQAIVEDGTLYMSGQVGWDDEFQLAGNDIESQTRKAFENVEAILDEIGKSLSDITKVTAHIVDPHERTDGFFEVWNGIYSSEPYPCLTILGPQQLAQEGFLVEIEIEVPVN